MRPLDKRLNWLSDKVLSDKFFTQLFCGWRCEEFVANWLYLESNMFFLLFACLYISVIFYLIHFFLQLHINNCNMFAGHADWLAGNKRFSNSNWINPQENNFKYISAPYIKGTSERVNRILNNFHIRLGHKPTNTLRNKLWSLKGSQWMHMVQYTK